MSCLLEKKLGDKVALSQLLEGCDTNNPHRLIHLGCCLCNSIVSYANSIMSRDPAPCGLVYQPARLKPMLKRCIDIYKTRHFINLYCLDTKDIQSLFGYPSLDFIDNTLNEVECCFTSNIIILRYYKDSLYMKIILLIQFVITSQAKPIMQLTAIEMKCCLQETLKWQQTKNYGWP